ncbi:DAK2 domain-containing protein [Corynebacterium sp. TA-R-1]|uniref:DAK2 domain-containing protein n=1 Tax=Corynebacterium stercoris TaxID=2943490 RepID=A0ABT1G6D7_9CORY|nr:DAK2 domain-containing protein [Corynebacterium stercoris]MCP1388593.1 DAK2 domain-containing protein [Corynebacterium stercoris]
MAPAPAFDGPRLLAWARRAADELNRRRVEINELNVFPVPDADTGSNMAHTMASAVAEADDLAFDAPIEQVASALAVGAVKGARGNSGVVLSQVIRGLAQSMHADTPGGVVIADALAAAVTFVDRAIADPVEGTVITVLRAASVAATQAVAEAQDPTQPTIENVAAAATEAARIALANTPSQLEVLREAGVVDAGGTGLVVLLEALTDEAGGGPQPALTGQHKAAAGPAGAAAADHHGIGGNIEVMFMFDGDLDALERALAPLGDSLVIARIGEGTGKVHIHSTSAGQVIEQAYGAGAVSDLRLEVLPPEPTTHAPERLIIAVTPPGSLTALYEEFGALTVAPGPDAVADILAAIRRSGASEVLLLPNGLLDGRNLAAVEKAAGAFEQTVTLLPTVRLVSGIAALTVHDPAQPLATAAFTMSEAAGEMRTAVAHRAPRAGLIQGGAVAKGDVVVTSHGETVCIDEDALRAVEGTCARFLEHGGEQVTILYDPQEPGAEEANEVLGQLAERLGVEVMAYPADGLGAIAEIGVE